MAAKGGCTHFRFLVPPLPVSESANGLRIDTRKKLVLFLGVKEVLLPFSKLLEDKSSFCGATDVPVLDFW